MNVVFICGYIILTATVIFGFRQSKSGYAAALSTVAVLAIIRYALGSSVFQLEFLRTLFENQAFGEAGTALLKIFGITVAVETTSDVCRDSGENALASKIELVGKIEILAVSIPILKNILEITKEIMT